MGKPPGIVIETAADVTSVCPGDAVMGLFPANAFAPTAVTDARMLMAVPPGWSFPQAASVPVAFLTAYIALVDIAQLSAGQRVLIHAGAGGVGQAAIPIAGHLGAQVYATAHPTKHHILADLGVARDRIASSRNLDFVDTFNTRHPARRGCRAQQFERRVRRRLAGPSAPGWVVCGDRQDRYPRPHRPRRYPPGGRLPRLRPGRCGPRAADTRVGGAHRLVHRGGSHRCPPPATG